ncbi:hypothetical protein RHSIM_Rhsim05G0033600 [Rhododendron simsii]|uniref:Uncharacterized protein n=1 Tax=Rhododendron simsii TaxID=118357 RepID=A0A834LNT5_RHOSS|nr:hypothetical protein RHSIM_Rhsim05G0033600 [Rhododendron simsii]
MISMLGCNTGKIGFIPLGNRELRSLYNSEKDKKHGFLLIFGSYTLDYFIAETGLKLGIEEPYNPKTLLEVLLGSQYLDALHCLSKPLHLIKLNPLLEDSLLIVKPKNLAKGPKRLIARRTYTPDQTEKVEKAFNSDDSRIQGARNLFMALLPSEVRQLDYSMATCGRGYDWLGDFTATCRSREEQMKLETIKTPAMDPGYEDVISDFRTSVRKIVNLDDHIALACAGLKADALVLINRARIECQSHKLTVEDPVTVEYITRYIAGLQ